MSETEVSTGATGLRNQPAVAAFRGMSFFVVWCDSTDATIRGRMFQSDGDPSGDDLVVNTPTPTGANTDRLLPTVEAWGGGLAVAWIERPFNPPGPVPHVKLQLFDREGRRSGDEIQVSTSPVDSDHRPAVTSMIDGGFLVVWTNAGSDPRILAQRFGPEGTRIGPEVTVTTTSGFHQRPVATRLVDGNVVIAWRSDPSPPGGGSITFRLFDLEGQPQSGEIKPNLSGFRGPKAIAFLDTGGFVITYIRYGLDSDLGQPQSIVEANFFNPDGSHDPGGMSVNHGEGITSDWPDLATLSAGRFLAVWTQESAVTFATTPAVSAGIFTRQQGPVAPGIQVSTGTTGRRSQACTAAIVQGLDGDSAFVAWVGYEPGSSHSSVRGRAYRIVDPGQLV